VNIPYHPEHLHEIAKGDHRSFDPQLNGTYRVAQRAIVNLYKEWVPETEMRLIYDGKWAGVTDHYKTQDVTNFNLLAKHSEDTIVKPSYINAGASNSGSGTASLDDVQTTVISALSNDEQTSFEFEGSAAEPIVHFAAPIDWSIRMIISKNNPINPSFAMAGKHDGFPSYEIYINSNHSFYPHTSCLQWMPPLSAGVLDLVGDMDTQVNSNGLIDQ